MLTADQWWEEKQNKTTSIHICLDSVNAKDKRSTNEATERDENIGLKQDKTVKLSDMDFDQLYSLLFYSGHILHY